MKSELKLSTPNLKVTFILGLCATTLIVALSLIFRFEFGLILLSVAGSFSLIGATKTLINIRQYRYLNRANNLELAKQQQELRLITYQADKAQLESFTLTFPSTHRIATLPDSPVSLIEGVVKQLPATIVTNDNLPDLMDKIGNRRCMMFLGPAESGKSETAAHWIKARSHLFLVCDPKEEDFIWPVNCRVYNDFDLIFKTIKQLRDELERRRQKQLKGLKSITLFFDELHTLKRKDKEIIEIILDIATLGRSYNVHCAFTGHAKTTKYLGVDAVALLDNFAKVRMTFEHRCFVDIGEGEFEVKHPGRYRQQVIVNRDDKIRDMIKSGMSNYAISQEIWGNRNKEIYDYINSLR